VARPDTPPATPARAAARVRPVRVARPAVYGDKPKRRVTSRQAAVMVQVFVATVFVFPSDSVIRVVGAGGYVSGLVAIALFVAWVLMSIFGFHDPVHTRYPVRGALGLLWISSLLSYAAIPFYAPTAAQRLGADRWIMLLIGISGVVGVTAELVRTPLEIIRVVRAVVWGASFSAVVALVQYFLLWDLKPYLRLLLPGFAHADDYGSFQARDALIRVTGTSLHPIELGVVAGMVLPLAIWLAFYGEHRSTARRWGPVILIAMCIPMSVSRSAVLTVAVSLAVFVVALPVERRAWLIVFMPVGAVAILAGTPGYLKTIIGSFTNVTTDASVTNRLNNYPRVQALVADAPWIGRGGGTNIAADATKILDNQYLNTAIELGLLGLVALILFFVVPVIAALTSRRHSRQPAFRALCGAVAGGCLGAAIGSYTLDSFSFPQFVSVEAVLVGLCGAAYLYARRRPDDRLPWPDDQGPTGPRGAGA
jgi:O-antigen ligase